MLNITTLTETIDLTSTSTVMTTGTFILCTIVSLVLGAVIAFSFSIKQKTSKSFTLTLALLPLIVQVVIMLVNGNLGTGVAVMGAFSLVRFRSIPGNARDICAIFLSMAVGLATGTNHLLLAAIFTAVVCVIGIIYTLSPFGETGNNEKMLSVIIPESLDYTDVFNDIFDKYTKSAKLVSVKTTHMGSLFKLTYNIVIKSDVSEKEMIDEIRCRNGNLEITCAQVISEQEKL